MPLVARCVNSMMVARVGECGVISPWHSGQWLPQPAPESVALTNAPQRATAML